MMTDGRVHVCLMCPNVVDHLTVVLRKACVHVEEGCTAEILVTCLLHVLVTPPPMTTLRVNSLLERKAIAQDLDSLHSVLAKQYREKGAQLTSMQRHTLVSDAVLIQNVGPKPDCLLAEQSGKTVIVGLQCGMAILRGADVFSPGVLAVPKGLVKGDQVLVCADVEGKCRRGLAVPFHGNSWFVGVGVACLSRHELFGLSATNCGIAIRMTCPLYVAPSMNDQFTSSVFVQNFPSIVVSHVLDPKPEEKVLDLCAAPGGKTTHLAMLMQDKGCVIALDKTKLKVAKLEQNVSRFCLSSIHCYVYDSTKSVDTTKLLTSCQLPVPPPYPCGTFDRVLLDGPCSALGQRPQVSYMLSVKELCSYPPYQRKLFTQAVLLLKPGGVLVYSTCSISPEENECQVHWALETFSCLSLAVSKPLVGYPGLLGYGLSQAQCNMVQRFGSSCFFETLGIAPLTKTLGKDQEICMSDGLAQDTVGFFIAKFIKK